MPAAPSARYRISPSAGRLTGVGGTTQIENAGTVTGFVQFGGGDNSFLNNGLFNLRHFADTTGDGGRDTLRVAIADLGTGPNNSFTNNGTLALPAVTGATTLDSTGQYLPLGQPQQCNGARRTVAGPLDRRRRIDVHQLGHHRSASNPVAGDVLVITGARQAGAAGPGTFISNGGTLRLDTVLNEGGAATRSDTLVVDGTSVGAGGPTRMAIRNAGGAGALTVGDGILVVEGLNDARQRVFHMPSGSAGRSWPVPTTIFSSAAARAPARATTGSCAALFGPVPPEPPAEPGHAGATGNSAAGDAKSSARRFRFMRRCR